MDSTKRLFCGHCRITVEMEVLIDEGKFRVFSADIDDESLVSWEIYRCPSCSKPTLIELNVETFPDLDNPCREVHQRILYPTASDIFHYIPEAIGLELRSAFDVRHRNNNAFAVCVGRTLEVICRSLNADGKDLYSQIKNLVQRGLLPEPLGRVADSIRLLRNLGAHASIGNVSDSEAEILHNLLIVVLEYLYKAPALLKQLEEGITGQTQPPV